MEQPKIRIILVDDHHLVRETWKLLLEQEPNLEIVAECHNGAEAIIAAGTHPADVMLMDINMQPVNGFEATKKIAKKHPLLKIIGVSVNDQPSYARNMIQLGARGYVTKDCSREEMIRAIVTVHKGGTFISSNVRKKMNE